MYSDVISEPIYRVLSDLTQESRVEVALPPAIKDWLRLKLKEACAQQELYRQRYGMEFSAFKQSWQEGRISDRHSYEVERDYWEWEAATTDEERLQEMLESLP
ncbi:MAG: hypothetical protein ACP5JJ_16345 [Anaerolineae bacterium]